MKIDPFKYFWTFIIFLVKENYFSTEEKVFSIVKNISGPSKIYLERKNYFSANKIILDHFCPVWLSIRLTCLHSQGLL